MIGLSVLLLPCCVLTSSALTPTEGFLQGFYRAYTSETFPGCALPSPLFSASLETLLADFTQKHTAGLTLAHAADAYEELQAVLESCHLAPIASHFRTWLFTNGVDALFTKLDGEAAEGTVLKFVEDLQRQDWAEAGTTLGQTLADLIPPEVDTEPLHSVNFFQKLDNFTAGVFVGFESNPKKPVACLTTYNSTAQYFRNTSSIIEGCVRLYLNDCKKIRDMVPDVIIHLQALVLSCKLQDLWEIILGLADPTTWSQIVVSYYWNMATITATWNDLLQSYILKKYRQMGIDFGTIIRIILGFKLN